MRKPRLPIAAGVLLVALGLVVWVRGEVDSRYDYVDRLGDLNKSQEAPGRLTKDFPPEQRDLDGLKLPEDFDVGRYFDHLDHLHMAPGASLDWVYAKWQNGGFPILYGRSVTAPPYRYFADLPLTERDEKGRSPWFPPLSYLEKVETDGTQEGFVQLAVLAVVGGQFYQVWHAHYNDLVPICSRRQMLRLLWKDGRLPWKTRLRAAIQRVTPRVSLSDTEARVDLLTFTQWGGFQRQRFVFSRQAPHILRSRKTETVVAYDCGVLF